jgi:membrane fusion protein, multidrug efflux system
MRLKAIFANEDERLWPGDFVNARVSLELRRDALIVPSVAIQRGPDGIFIWVVTPDNTVQARNIASGPSTGNLTIITSGLEEGERVVVDGQYKLRQDGKVTVNVPSAPAAASVPAAPSEPPTPAVATRGRAS